MESHASAEAALTVAIALAAGMIAQVIARHLRIPGIVLLLTVGALLGPDGIGIVLPGTLDGALQLLVGFAVSIVLFEGALDLNLARLRRQGLAIRRLVTIGGLITAAAGTVAARWLLGWDWRLALLFGTLVIVTGPTVINPLVRRIRLRDHVATVLEAEGVFIDAIGAIVAVVALEIILQPDALSLAGGGLEILMRLGAGTVIGVAVGLLLGLLLRYEFLMPRGLDNVFALSVVLLTFQGSNALMPESGIMAVIAAGATLANFGSRLLEDLREFKEQLTVLMLGMLFVLLAADVRLEEVRSLGWPGVWTVAALMFIVRPLNVVASTAGSDLSWRERVFVSWMAPRGIVAAAVASLFAQSLEAAGIPGGAELRALVFLVIAVTVVIYGLTGKPLAGWLRLRRDDPKGYAILGASAIGRTIASRLRDAGEPLVLIDSNPVSCRQAEEEGFRVIFGSALSDPVLLRSRLEDRVGVIAVTSNDEVNYSFAQRAKQSFHLPTAWLALNRGFLPVTEAMVEEIDGRILFGEPRNLSRWEHLIATEMAPVEEWVYAAETKSEATLGSTASPGLTASYLPLLIDQDGGRRPYDETVSGGPGDRLHLAIVPAERDEVVSWLEEQGWRRAGESPGDD